MTLMDHLNLKWNSLAPLISLVLLIYFPSFTVSNLNSEKQALLTFASSVHHGLKLNWNPSTSVCSSWVGIKCSKIHNQTHVYAIRLPGIGLSGRLPPNTLSKLEHLQFLSLRSNNLNGSLPIDIPSLPSLHYLNLQQNAFNGTMPSSFSKNLNVIDLSHNNFSGEIPLSIQNLSQLTTLFLENNTLSGPIPDLKLQKLNHLNFSYNKFNGTIPLSLQRFSNDSFVGNIQLCGPPLRQCSGVHPSPLLPNSSPQPPFPHINEVSSTKKLKTRVIIVIIAGGVALFLLVAVVLVLCIIRKKRKEGVMGSKKKTLSIKKVESSNDDYSSGVQMAEKNKLVFFEGCSYNFDLEDLLRASAEVLGKGSYGTTYKAVLEDGITVVVKRLKEVMAGKKEFEQQMESIDRVGQHQNLVSIRAYYYSKDEKLIVYEYATHGSFSSLLHGNRGTDARIPLNWEARLKILLSTAKAILHIHSEQNPKFTHGNIKSSNILMTDNLTPIISDYALAPLMNNLPSSSSRSVPGYRAPEFVETSKLTTKTDVYSFGVVILEALTGKSPVQAHGYDDVSDLPRWVHSVVREEWTAEVFDVELMKGENIEEDMVQMLQLGLACSSRDPNKRPSMMEVVRMMEEIRRVDSESTPTSEIEI